MNAKTNGVVWVSQQVDSTDQTENIHLGPAVIHRLSGRVETPAGAQRLRTKELALVEHLFQHASITFSREELLLRVWRCQPGLLNVPLSLRELDVRASMWCEFFFQQSGSA